MKSVIVTPPTVEPVILDEIREHSRIDIHEEDSYFETRITGAREAAEGYTQSRYITQTWDDSFDSFWWDMVLAQQPVQSITSVTYTDTDGDTQTLANTVYELGTLHGLGILRLKFNQTWPTDVQRHPDAVTVRYVAGYGLAVDVPQRIKQAIELYVSHFNEAREGEDPLSRSFQNMLGPYCFKRFPNPPE
jgi:uncharacterized phiE125 gp8 family phage protein